MDMVDMVTDMTAADVERWLKTQHQNCVPLQWFGKGAKAMGLEGDADPEMVRQVLCDGVTPNGERIGTFVPGVGRIPDVMTSIPQPPVAYYMEFRAHESVFALAADGAPESVLELHDWSTMTAVEKELEDGMGTGLVAVVATYHNDPISEVVFSFTDRYRNSRAWWLARPGRARPGRAQQAAQAALAAYQRRLGDVLARLLGIKVIYETSPDYGLPIAVAKYWSAKYRS